MSCVPKVLFEDQLYVRSWGRLSYVCVKQRLRFIQQATPESLQYIHSFTHSFIYSSISICGYWAPRQKARPWAKWVVHDLIYYGPGMEGSLHREKGGDDSVVKTKSPGFGARGQGLASLFMGSDPWVRHKPSLWLSFLTRILGITVSISQSCYKNYMNHTHTACWVQNTVRA